MTLGASFVGLLYIIIQYGFEFKIIKALVMALAYSWGLILAIYLMGHGLVSIPRRLIRDATLSSKLRRLQTKAPALFEKMGDAAADLEEIEAQIFELGKRKIGSAADYQDWIEELHDIANISPAHPPRDGSDPHGTNRIIPTVITDKYLAELTRRTIRARHTSSRYASEWHRLVQEASTTQKILDSAASKKLELGMAGSHESGAMSFSFLTPYQRHIWCYYAAPYLQLALGFVLAGASACIVWSEVVKVAFPKLSVISVTVVHHWVGDKAEIGLAGQVISAMWICYMCAAAFISMTEVKVWRGRALVKRNTSYESAFWYASQVAKLTIPLVYNFLTFLSTDIYEKTTFYDFLGKLINLTPLGSWFDDLFPILVLFPVCATMFGLYGRVKRMFVGIDLMDDEDEENPSSFGTGTWREGRSLIERELNGESIRRREDLYARLENAGGGSNRNLPVLSVPPAQGGSSSRLPVPSSMGISSASPSTRGRYLDEPPEDESFLQLLGHRMKNTIDGIEAPKWFTDIGQGIQRPKWMAPNDSQNSGQSRGADSDLRSWFGGGGSSSNTNRGGGASDNGGQIRLG